MGDSIKWKQCIRGERDRRLADVASKLKKM